MSLRCFKWNFLYCSTVLNKRPHGWARIDQTWISMNRPHTVYLSNPINVADFEGICWSVLFLPPAVVPFIYSISLTPAGLPWIINPCFIVGKQKQGRESDPEKESRASPLFECCSGVCVTQRKASETNITHKDSASPAGLWLPCMMTELWQATVIAYLKNRKQCMAAPADIPHSSYVRRAQAGTQRRRRSRKHSTVQIYCMFDEMFRWWWWVGRLHCAERALWISQLRL